MKALILSAGWGTRLRPLSFYRPKVLMPLGEKTILEHWLETFEPMEEIFINSHGLHPLLENHLKRLRKKFKNLRLIYEPSILGSGGTIYKVSSMLDSQWLVVANGDIFLRGNILALLEDLAFLEPAIYLLLKENPAFNNVVVDSLGNIKAFRRTFVTEEESKRGYRVCAFTGLQLIHTSLIKSFAPLFVDAGKPGFRDIISIYGHMLSKEFPVKYRILEKGSFFDIGTVGRYFTLCKEVGFLGSCGNNTIIERGAVVRNSILWDRVLVKSSSFLDSCIVTDGVIVDGYYERSVITPYGASRFEL